MSDNTPRLDLPFIRASQSQKEVTHNEALMRLDALVQPVAEAIRAEPPTESPADLVDGETWIVDANATGAWAGQEGRIARAAGGAWAFVVPADGFRVWLRDQGCEARFDGTAWQVGQLRASVVMVDGDAVLGPRGAAVADPDGGTTVDAEARGAITALLNACRAHGLINS